ncbi:MAG: N-acetyltransferase family protein [Clostridia bacterium]|nr:N-acetyltransferase family protein [Clostridia bacterium]
MDITFAPLSQEHAEGVMRIFNYYVENGTAAFPGKALPVPFFGMFLKKSEGYPAYALLNGEHVVGFCQLSAYNPFSSFTDAACLTYFIDPACTGKGLGSQCLARLEAEAKERGICHLVAEVSSENEGSLSFHKQHGFSLVGELPEIGSKFGRRFGVCYLQKTI